LIGMRWIGSELLLHFFAIAMRSLEIWHLEQHMYAVLSPRKQLDVEEFLNPLTYVDEQRVIPSVATIVTCPGFGPDPFRW